MAPVTLLYAGILILLSILLANQVLYVRLRGDREPEWKENTVQRVQSNFVENVPLSLLLLFLIEISGTHTHIVHTMGILLTIFRILHAWGMSRSPGANYPRLIGAQGTFLLMAVMGFTAIILGINNL
tara:strand:- start:672 stop:1052 length:381 start_codon:yes stop_codon:yes gene_type:complete